MSTEFKDVCIGVMWSHWGRMSCKRDFDVRHTSCLCALSETDCNALSSVKEHHIKLISLTCQQTIAYLYIQQTQSNISIHMKLNNKSNNSLKSSIHSSRSFVFVAFYLLNALLGKQHVVSSSLLLFLLLLKTVACVQLKRRLMGMMRIQKN